MQQTFSCRTLLPAILILMTLSSSAQDLLKSQPPLWSTKPDIAAFEKIENDRLAVAQHAIDQILAVKGARTIDNTLGPYDEAIRQLNAASYFSTLMQQVHPDATFRDHATAMTTRVSSAQTALSLNRDVYRALASLDISKTDPATRYYIQRQLLEFRLAGVDKDDSTRAKLKTLQDRLTDDQSMFDRNISDDPKSVAVTDASELDGLPQDYIDKHKPGTDGKIHVTTNYPDLFPVLKFANSDGLRRSLWIGSGTGLHKASRVRALCLFLGFLYEPFSPLVGAGPARHALVTVGSCGHNGCAALEGKTGQSGRSAAGRGRTEQRQAGGKSESRVIQREKVGAAFTRAAGSMDVDPDGLGPGCFEEYR